MISSLPSSPAIFVGRERELERIARATEHLRLVLVYGMPGMGKTSLLLRAANDLANRQRGRVVYHSCRPSESAATAVGAGLEQLGGTHPNRPRPLESLLASADTVPIVLCLDDLHRGVESSLFDAIVHLAGRQRPLWLFCASRATVPISPVVIDHLVVMLGPLDAPETTALWDSLVKFYGSPPGAGLPPAGTRSPLEIKQLFAGVGIHTTNDPLGLAALTELESAVLAQICAFRRAAPVVALQALGAPEDTKAVVEHLVARFLVERAGPDAVQVHDVVREAVARAPFAPARDEHLRCLDHYGSLPPDDTTLLERTYHAVAAEEDALALQLLCQEADRMGFPPRGTVADSDLADACDRLAQRRSLPPAVRAMRARFRARQGDPERARLEIQPLLGSVPLAPLDYGSIAVVLGRAEEALATLGPMMDNETLLPSWRLLAFLASVGAYRDRGDTRGLRRALARARPFLESLGALGTGMIGWVEAVINTDEERYDVAAASLGGAEEAFESASLPGLPLVVSLDLLLAAERGAPAGESAPGEFLDEIPFLRYTARLLCGRGMLLRGDAQAVVRLADEVIAAVVPCGLPTLGPEAAQLAAEADLMLGRLAEARARVETALAALSTQKDGTQRVRLQLGTTHARTLLALGEKGQAAQVAKHVGVKGASVLRGTRARLDAVLLHATGQQPRRSQALTGFDDCEWRLGRMERFLVDGRLAEAEREARIVTESATMGGWRHLACRAQLALAEAALRRGDPEAATAALAFVRSESQTQGYALLLTACDTLEAALGRAHGRDTAPRQDALARRLGLDRRATLVLQDSFGRRALAVPTQLEDLDLTKYAFVLDAVRRQVKTRSWKRLGGRSALANVLAAFARRPGRFVTTEELTREAWGEDYHPVRHHSRVTTAILRLRRLLGERVIDGSREGYRLAPPEPWLVIVPIAQTPTAAGVS